VKILIGMGHPAHVHFFKNAINIWKEHGHQVEVIVREKEITKYLLDAYDIPHRVFVNKLGSDFHDFIKEWWTFERATYKLLKEFKPDIATSIGGAVMVHACKLFGVPFISWNDSEPIPIQGGLTHPFASAVLTPYCFGSNLGKHHFRYNGFHEIAYLCKPYFSPSKEILNGLRIKDTEKFVIMRFIGWDASHDLGKSGFDMEQKRKTVKELSKHAKVYITSESVLPKDLEEYHISIPPEKIHDALYYSALLIGDSQTMTTEAAILGTPAIRSNSFVGENDMMNFLELEKSGLIYNMKNPDEAIELAVDMIQQNDLKIEWHDRKDEFLADKIDVTRFMVWFIENYPDSLEELPNNTKITKKIK